MYKSGSNAKKMIGRKTYAAPIIKTTIRIKRNEPCPCNSGNKFKHCCMQKPKTTYPSTAVES